MKLKNVLLGFLFLIVFISNGYARQVDLNIRFENDKYYESYSLITHIKAIYDDELNQIFVYFVADFPEIEVTITKDGIELYNNVLVNTQNTSITIDVDGYQPGVYDLNFVKPDGSYLHGEFIIE